MRDEPLPAASRGESGGSPAGHAPGNRSAIVRALMWRGFVPVVLAAAVALRIGWIIWAVHAGVHPSSDAAWYLARAAGMAEGEGYRIAAVPTAYWPVGYPAFLAGLFTATGVSPLAGMLANAFLGCAALFVMYRICRTLLNGNEPAARITLLALALQPNGIAYSSLLLSEPLALLLSLAATLPLLEERRISWRCVVAGVLAGLAALVKPQLALAPLVAIAALPAGQPRLRVRALRAGCVALVAVAVVLPWTLRNQALYGHPGIVANNDGINLYIGNNPRANGTYLLDDEIETAYGGGDEYERNARARSLAIAYMTSEPLATALRLPRKLWYLYRSDVDGVRLNRLSLPDPEEPPGAWLSTMLLLAEGWWIVVLGTLLAAIPTLARLRRRTDTRDAIRLATAMMILFTAIPLIYFGDSRFHFPATPWIVLPAAMFAAELLGRRERSAGGTSRAGERL
ncbi:MAG TPA: glycosyltransferase family 39 protein [Candidatus Kapabacteria bacterium]|nr:glycosyltransferase family 39 protein [Candidatus Kapabacteria bacterium]